MMTVVTHGADRAVGIGARRMFERAVLIDHVEIGAGWHGGVGRRSEGDRLNGGGRGKRQQNMALSPDSVIEHLL